MNESTETAKKEITVILKQLNIPIRDYERIEQLVDGLCAAINRYDQQVKSLQKNADS